MSALPPKADIALHRSECPLCAKSRQSAPQHSARVFDHFVSGGKQRLRYCEAEYLRRLEI